MVGAVFILYTHDYLRSVELIEIGYIVKTHGYKGELKARIYSSIEFDIDAVNAFFLVDKGEKVPYFVEDFYFAEDEDAFIKFEEIDSKEIGKKFKSSKLYLDEKLISFADEFAELKYKGYQLHDINHGNVGIVEDVIEYPHQIMLETTVDGNSILVPFQEALIESINEADKTITFNLPEGFLEI